MPSPYGKPGARRVNGWVRDDRRELQRPARAKAPPIPVRTWPAPVKRWWRAVWTHPVSCEWDEVADLQAVARLGSMYAEANSGRPLNAATAAQITRLEAELLLLPAARKRAYVRLPSPEAEPRTSGPDYRAMLAADERRAARRARLTETGVERDDPFAGLQLMDDGTIRDDYHNNGNDT